jgi:hypothetical protein
MPDIQAMIGKEVEVTANGISYRGELVEITDNEVNLKTLMQWISLPTSTVNTIRIVGQIRQEPAREGIFYGDDRQI